MHVGIECAAFLTCTSHSVHALPWRHFGVWGSVLPAVGSGMCVYGSDRYKNLIEAFVVEGTFSLKHEQTLQHTCNK